MKIGMMYAMDGEIESLLKNENAHLTVGEISTHPTLGQVSIVIIYPHYGPCQGILVKI